MRIVFMGTPTLAAQILERLADAHDVVGVYTRPDAIRGRGSKLVASPVKAVAESRGIPVCSPASFKEEGALEQLESLEPDVVCVAAYGLILPARALKAAPLGCLNVHTSLLPRWRGAAPIERAILAGDAETGVCIMRMEEGLDTGPYCVRKTCPVADKYLAELADELSALGSDALLEALDLVSAGTATWTCQDDEAATYAGKLAKGELDIDPTHTRQTVMAHVRAASPSRPCRTTIAGRSVAIERAGEIERGIADAVGPLDAGEATLRMKRLLIGVSDGIIEVVRVKPDGKSSMDARAFASGIQGMKNQIVQWGRA